MRNYKRKTDRQKWESEDMEKAIKTVVDKTHGIRKASKLFNIPKSTLKNRLKKYKDGCSIEEACKKGLGQFRAIFSDEQEKELVDYIKKLQNECFDKLTTKDLRKFAYKYAEINNIDHKFNNEDEMAGADWYIGFIKRNPEFSIRNNNKNQSTSDDDDNNDNVDLASIENLLCEEYKKE